MVDDDKRLSEALSNLVARRASSAWCVAGAGNGGLAVAGVLGIRGFPVRLYNRTAERLDAVRWHGGIRVEGVIEGFGPVGLATSDIAAALEGTDVVMVVTPANAHAGLARAMAPHLRDGQVIVLNPGRTGGALEFRQVLRAEGCTAAVLVAEAQTFLYAARALSRHEARIHGVKNSVPVASLPAYWIPDLLRILQPAFPSFVAGTNVLSTSLENIGAVFHPALTLLNAGWIEATGGDFEYYLGGITPAVARVLEQVDAERVAVAAALGVHTVTAREWLYLSYDSAGADLHAAIKATVGYRGIKAPAGIMHRYVSEDIPMSLVPLASIGAMLGVPTPAIDLVIDLGCMMHGRDYRAEGRTVERLGLKGLDVRQIRHFVVGAVEGAPPPEHGRREGA